MGTISLNKGSGSAVANGERVVLPTDMYRVRCMESELEDDTFAKPDKKTGQLPQKIKTVWEVVRLTDEQQEAAEVAEEEWEGVRIWHRFNPYYGPVKAGGPSKTQEFIDLARTQGYLADFDIDTFDPESLVGIELKASIASYIKTMGENVGQPGNKITAWAGLKAPKKAKAPATDSTPHNVPQTIESDADLPF